MNGLERAHERLHHAASGASIDVPHGWRVIEDVGAVTCEAPSARADVTGRVAAARISIELREPQVLVAHRPLGAIVRDLVDDARADHPHAWLLDCVPWRVRTQAGHAPRALAPPSGGPPALTVTGVRVDLAQHDMTTPLVVSTVLVPLDKGLLCVTASIPVAHQGALGADVDGALDSLLLASVQQRSPATTTAADMAAQQVAYSSPATWITVEALDVFVAGSYKIAARWRPEPLAAGLVDARGVATGLGGFVRRALSRPDVRASLSVHPVELLHDAEAANGAGAVPRMTVDRLDGYAVVRATAPPVRGTPGKPGVREQLSIEVLDLAAAPARAAAWLGLGPGRTAQLSDGTLAVLGSSRPAQPGARAEYAGVVVSALPGPREAWARLLDALS